MKKLVVTLAFILLLSIICVTQYTAKSEKKQGYVVYTVKKGDSLSVIAEKYKGKYDKTRNFVTEIKVNNGLVSDDLIAGRTLLIPEKKE